MRMFDERLDDFAQRFRNMEKKYAIEQEYGKKVL